MVAYANTSAPCKTGFERAYHIHKDAKRACWDVIDEDGRVHGHAHDLRQATDLAIQQAHIDHVAGHDVTVCVEQDDGAYIVAWSSR